MKQKKVRIEQMLKDKKGIIFDLDGTILDSSWVWDKVDIKFLGDRGFDVPDDYVEAISPMGAEKAAEYTIERFGLQNERPEDLVGEWFDMAKSEYHHKVVCKPHAKRFIKKMYSQGKKLVIATSSDKELFIPTLAREGILDYFSDIVTVNEVERGKGFPDIYIEAAKRIDFSVRQCVVFEDIITAIKGAKSGGFQVVAVEDEKSAYYSKEIRAIADLYISSYQQLL